jgi:hypothetical protein
MTDRKQLDHIADLMGGEPPMARPLTPDVRSGATFPFVSRGNSDDPFAPFVVIWVYKVVNRNAFAGAVRDFEDSIANPPSIVPGQLAYRGTYSVSVSSAAPEFEYRSIWCLGALADLQVLNEHLADSVGNPKLHAMIKLIDRDKPMRTEIMGRTTMAMIV